MIREKTAVALSDALDIEHVPTNNLTVIPNTQNTAVVLTEDRSAHEVEDYTLVRDTYRTLIKKGKSAVEDMQQVAEESQDKTARNYEALSILIRSVADTARDLYDLHQKSKDLKNPTQQSPDINTNIDKAIFCGTPADLLKQLKMIEDEKP